MSRRRHPVSSSTTAAAMSLAELERWLQGRAERRPVAAGMPVLDGYVAAIVAGPVSISPLDWICPLLAIDADAFNHGGTPEFAAISAVVQHHNAISNTLSNNPTRFEPIHLRKPNGDVDARPWCRDSTPPCSRDYQPGRHCSTSATSTTACSCPSCCTAWTTTGIRCSDRRGRAARPKHFCATPTPISQPSSKPCASTGCRSATLAQADYCRRGCSCRLL